jgi:cobalt-zinc-cadmium efflux system membrane fusion protein
MKTYLSISAAVVAGLALGLSLGGFHAQGRDALPAAADATSSGDPRQIAISPELAQRAKLKLQPVEAQSLTPTLRLLGSVDFDADHLAEVGARIEGRVARMLVEVGSEVKRDDALVEIESAALGEAAATLLSVRANLIAAENSEQRESLLSKQQLSSAAVVERARAEVNALRAELHGSEQRLLAMGLSTQEIERLKAGHGPRRITLRSPLDGEVVRRDAVLGQVVDPTQPVLRVANLDHVWVELDVFERDLPRVAEGNRVEIECEALPGERFTGKVMHVDATVDLATRTAGIRVEVPNQKRLLRPGQFVRARLATEGVERRALAIPNTALFQVEGEPSVFVALERDRYAVRPVELGATVGDVVEVTRGLAEGDLIVVEGGFALKSELLR